MYVYLVEATERVQYMYRPRPVTCRLTFIMNVIMILILKKLLLVIFMLCLSSMHDFVFFSDEMHVSKYCRYFTIHIPNKCIISYHKSKNYSEFVERRGQYTVHVQYICNQRL